MNTTLASTHAAVNDLAAEPGAGDAVVTVLTVMLILGIVGLAWMARHIRGLWELIREIIAPFVRLLLATVRTFAVLSCVIFIVFLCLVHPLGGGSAAFPPQVVTRAVTAGLL